MLLYRPRVPCIVLIGVVRRRSVQLDRSVPTFGRSHVVRLRRLRCVRLRLRSHFRLRYLATFTTTVYFLRSILPHTACPFRTTSFAHTLLLRSRARFVTRTLPRLIGTSLFTLLRSLRLFSLDTRLRCLHTFTRYVPCLRTLPDAYLFAVAVDLPFRGYATVICHLSSLQFYTVYAPRATAHTHTTFCRTPTPLTFIPTHTILGLPSHVLPRLHTSHLLHSSLPLLPPCLLPTFLRCW